MWIDRRAVLALALVAVATAACGDDPLEVPEAAEAARQHLDNVLAVMEANSINRRKINWADFRSTVHAAAGDIKDIQEAFDGIHTALGLLGDNHSSYTGPPGYAANIRNSQVVCTGTIAQQPDVPIDVGYVRVAGFSGSVTAAQSYARNLQTAVMREDAPGLVGWIVDLRGNTGGNMWPMIVGLGPILGERVLGYFIDPDGNESGWEYKGGTAILNGTVLQAVAPWYTLLSPDPKVAVLIDGRVASSGEASAIAFKARPDTRFFGTPTCGLSTANRGFAIDGATLTLTVSTIADRTKFAYGDTLPPDELIPDADQAVARAIAWLRGGGN